MKGAKIGVEKGFGPRHGNNAKEGDLTQVNSDVVPAMLTPREAVLNRNAAEMAGRGNIEKLNAEGNKLAKRGVDLAQEGEEDVPYPMRLPLEGADAARADEQGYRDDMLEELDQRMRARGLPPLRALLSTEQYNPRRALPSLQELNLTAQEGKTEVGMKEKAKKYQGGGVVPLPAKGKPPYPVGTGTGADPGIMPGGMPGANPYNSIGGGVPGSMPPEGIPGSYGPPRVGSPGWQRTHPNYAPSDPAASGGMPGMPTGVGSPFWRRTHPNYGSVPGQPGGGFYPPGAGIGMQGGAAEVPGIGAPNPQTAYGPPVQLRAGDVSKFLQQAGQQQGLSAGQISGLLKAFQGFGSGYNELTGGAGSAADMATAPTAGYQGGISDIGYPPFVAPNAEFHGDKGGWLGQYDPAYTFQHYWRGTSDTTPPRLRSAGPFR
jgi:hypothetical protein